MTRTFPSTGRIRCSLPVTDLARAVAFYRDVLGLDEMAVLSEHNWAELDSGIPGFTIGLGVDPGGSGPCQTTISFHVPDLEAARRALEERGVQFDPECIEMPWQARIALFYDPDGNPLALVQHAD